MTNKIRSLAILGVLASLFFAGCTLDNSSLSLENEGVKESTLSKASDPSDPIYIPPAPGPIWDQTQPGKTKWKQYGSRGLYVDIDTSRYKFSSTPIYTSSLAGNSQHWRIMGASSIYKASKTGFRVYIYNKEKAITPDEANAKKWYINWTAAPNKENDKEFAASRTTPGKTNWKNYGSKGVYVDINTSAFKISKSSSGTPVYITSLGGSSHHWKTKGASSVYKATKTGFRIYVYYEDGETITPDLANSYKWHINWMACDKSEDFADRTTPGKTNWKQYGSKGLYVDVKTSSASLWEADHCYITSLGGSSKHWNTTGVTSIYKVSQSKFRVYVFCEDGAITPEEANERKWHVNWFGFSNGEIY